MLRCRWRNQTCSLVGAVALLLTLPGPAWSQDLGSRVNGVINLDFSGDYITPRGLHVEDEGLVTQPLLLVLWKLRASKGLVESLAAADNRSAIERLYLAALSRPPTDEELSGLSRAMDEATARESADASGAAAPRRRVLEDLAWALSRGVPEIVGIRSAAGIVETVVILAVAFGAVMALGGGRILPRDLVAVFHGRPREASEGTILRILGVASLAFYVFARPTPFEIDRYLLPLASAALPLVAIAIGIATSPNAFVRVMMLSRKC